jgi:predicted amino acid-binding ACT domain protein
VALTTETESSQRQGLFAAIGRETWALLRSRPVSDVVIGQPEAAEPAAAPADGVQNLPVDEPDEVPMGATELLAVTVVGPDRPGVVASVTRVLHRAEATVMATSMTVLCGHSAMILLTRGAESTIQAAAEALRHDGLAVDVSRLAEVHRGPGAGSVWTIVGTATDRRVLGKLVKLLSDDDRNIVDIAMVSLDSTHSSLQISVDMGSGGPETLAEYMKELEECWLAPASVTPGSQTRPPAHCAASEFEGFAIGLVGTDRPGVVHKAIEALNDAGLQIEAASMTVLANQSAMILLIPGALSDEVKLGSVVEQLNKEGDVKAVTQRVLADQDGMWTGGGEEGHFRGHALDAPGILHRTAETFAERGVNITGIRLKIFGEPPVCALDVDFRLAETTDVASLRDDLVNLAYDVGWLKWDYEIGAPVA